MILSGKMANESAVALKVLRGLMLEHTPNRVCSLVYFSGCSTAQGFCVILSIIKQASLK